MSSGKPVSPLFADSPQATLLVDREGVVVDANAVALKTLARAKARVVGKPLLGFVVEDDRHKAREFFQQVLAGCGRSWIARIKRGDGVPRAQNIRAVPLGNGSGPQGILLFSKDLSSGRDGRPDAVQLQTLLENLPEQFVAVLDKGGRIRYSSGLSRTHYRDDVESLGMPYEELLGDDTLAARSLSSMLKEVAAGSSWAGAQWHVRKDGRSFPVQVFSSPYLDPKTGRVRGCLVVGRDASLVHRWRERAETSEPLANVGQLTASIGAELSAGLDRMRASLDGLEEASGKGRDELDREVERMGRFLGKLEDFCKREEGSREEISFVEVVESSLAGMKERIQEAEVRVSRSISSGLPPVWGEMEGLTKVVDVILENALEALEEAPAGHLDVSLSQHSRALLLKVSNTGSEVQADWIMKIFEPFFTTRPGQAGLGLSVARSVVLSHGGRIWAEHSDPDTLSVSVEVPLEPPEARIPFRPVPLTLARARSILVVDDDEAIRVVLRAFLEKVGFEVREAWSGRSALAQITAGHPPELVVTDLRMDDGSGYWFLQALQRDFPKLVSKTIIITGDSRAEAAGELAKTTGCPLVRKPFELTRLLEVIDQVSGEN